MKLNLWKKIIFSVLVVAAGFCSVQLIGGPAFDGDYLNKYKGGIDTPHTKLSSPYAMGKPKVLFLLCKDVSNGMEVKELAQRADLDLDVFFFTRPGEIGGKGIYYSQAEGVTPAEREESLIEKLGKPWDVIVLGSIQFKGLPASCKYLLLEKFRKGTGLVIMRYRKDFKFLWGKTEKDQQGIKYITNGMPYEGLYSWATGWYNCMTKRYGSKDTPQKDRVLRFRNVDDKWVIFPKGAPFEASMLGEHVLCYNTGKSRLVSIDDYIARGYWGRHLSLFEDEACGDAVSFLGMRKELDIHSTIFIKAIYWAAGMGPRASIVDLPVKTVKVKAETENVYPIKFAYSEKAPKSGYDLRWELIDKLGRKVNSGVEKLNGQAKELELKLPGLYASGFFLNLWLESDDKTVEDWGHVYLLAESNIKFGNLAFSKDFYERNDKVSGSIEAPDGSKVKISFIDRWGRDISSGVFTTKNGKAEFSLPLNDTESMRIAVVADLLNKNDKQVAEVTGDLFVSQMHEKDFLIAMWPSTADLDLMFINNYQTLAEKLGVNGVIDEGGDKTTLNGQLAVWRQHWVGRYFKDVNEPKALAKNLEMVKESAATARKYSRRTHLVGDEVRVGCELTEHGLPVWRAWLKKDYNGDIAKLNANWGTDYKSFDDIPVFTKEEIETYKKDHFPRYLDLKRFAQINTGDFLGKVRALTKPVSPHTLAGLQYLSLFKNDAECFARNMNLVSTASPTDPTLKLMRDMCEPGSLFGGWTGGYFNQRHEYRRLIWSNLFNGCNSLWLFIESAGEGMLACDGRIPKHIEWVMADYQAVVNGLGQFVMQATRLDSKVAILHDYRSVIGAERFDKLSRYSESHKVFDKILNDAGIQYHYIGGRELTEGILAKEGFKTLLLPFTTSITTKQAAAIKQFVKNGGTVIADIAPGIMNGHGKVVEKGMLADVFGVDQKAENQPMNGEVTSSVGIKLPFAMSMPGAKASTAKSFGNVSIVPAFFKNKYGKGTAWLLNFTPLAFGDLAEIGSEAECAAAFGKLFDVKPLVHFENAQNKPLPGIEIFNIYELGGRRMLVILPSLDMPEKDGAKVILNKKWYVCNTLNGKEYGYTKEIPLGKVKRYEPLIFDLSPVKITGITAKLSAKPVRGKIIDIPVSLEGRKSGEDIIHYELIGPDGKKCLWFNGQATLKNGRGNLKLPIALNEKAGKYHLDIIDVLSHKACTTEFTLE